MSEEREIVFTLTAEDVKTIEKWVGKIAELIELAIEKFMKEEGLSRGEAIEEVNKKLHDFFEEQKEKEGGGCGTSKC